ncbi:ABC transporter ATP-binding protein/permease [Corynebacterium sp. TAE3-ERU12]|nr:ABC transporter ATP-binding protein/permease [Corynebacterium sp. TAE3-ERU12]
MALLWRRCLHHPRILATVIACTTTVIIIETILPLLTRDAIDVATGQGDGGQFASWLPEFSPINAVIIALVGLAIFRAVVQGIRRYNSGLLSLVVQHDLRTAVLAALQRLDGPAQDRVRTGQVVSRSISDLQAIQGVLAILPLTLGAAAKIVLTLGVMLYLSVPLTIVGLSVVPILLFIIARSRGALHAATWTAQQQAAEVATHVEETVTGVRVVKAFAQEQREVTVLEQLARRLYALRMRAAKLSARFQPALQSLPQISLVANLALGGWLALRGTITIGTFVAFATYLSTLTALARLVSNMVISVQLVSASVERVQEIIDTGPDHNDPEEPHPLPGGPLGIVLDHVTHQRNGRTLLSDVSAEVPAGSTIAVVGPPASGKTVLTELLGRFYLADSGSIRFSGATASVDLREAAGDDVRRAVTVVPDEPFLASGSVRDNIAMGCSTADDAAIRQAAEDAQVTFLDELPQGWDTLIGERGHTLSGGQRQRIALARALLSRPKVLVLDDATSAIDADTEARIFDALGQRYGDITTVIIAHRSSTVDRADTVLVLDGGVAIGYGTPAELLATDTAFADLMDISTADTGLPASAKTSGPQRREPGVTVDAPDAAEPDWDTLWPAPAPPDAAGLAGIPPSAGIVTAASLCGTDDLGRPADVPSPLTAPQARSIVPSSVRQRPGAGRGGPGGGGSGVAGLGGMSTAMAATPMTPQLMERIRRLPEATEQPNIEAIDPSPGTPFRLVDLLRRVPGLIAAVIGLLLIAAAADLAFPLLVGAVVDKGVTAGNTSVIWQASLAGLGIVAISWIAATITGVLTSRTGERLLFVLRVRSFRHVHSLALNYFESQRAGRIMTRMTTDIDALSSFLQIGVALGATAIFTLAGVVAMLIIVDVGLSGIALLALPAIVVATVIFRRVSSRLYSRAREQVSTVNADFQEAIAGLRSSQMFHRVDIVQHNFAAGSMRYLQLRARAQVAVATFFPVINLIADITTAAVLWIGAGLVATGETSAGVLVSFTLYLGMMFSPIQQLSQVFDNYQQAKVGLDRIEALLATDTSVPDHGTRSGAAEAATGELELADAQFAYATRSFDETGTASTDSDHDKNVISGFDLQIAPGETVALVGATGAGKSTVVKLLARFHDPTSGAVLASGVDLREFPLQQWRQCLGYVPQEAHLFSGTIASNIAYPDSAATEADITEAARRVGALSTIAAMPGGFRHPVGERGRGLSSGQRQLIALARAEMAQPKLLLLDEATATLDPATEQAILAATNRAAQRRTAVIVAHRLATAARADRIIVLKNGCIQEQGSHETLLSAGGAYARLWKTYHGHRTAVEADQEHS